MMDFPQPHAAHTNKQPADDDDDDLSRAHTQSDSDSDSERSFSAGGS